MKSLKKWPRRFLYAVGVLLVVHLAILALLSCNLAAVGDGPAVLDKEAASWPWVVARSPRTIHLAQAQEKGEPGPSRQQLRSLNQRQQLRKVESPVQKRQNRTAHVRPISPRGAPVADHSVSVPEKARTASNSTGAKVRPVLKEGKQGIDETLVSSDRRRRLQPPSLLLGGEEHRELHDLRQEKLKREQRKRVALSQLANKEDETKTGDVLKLPDGARKPVKGKGVGGGETRDGLAQTVGEAKMGGHEKMGESERRKKIADVLVIQREKKEELNRRTLELDKKWKLRKSLLDKEARIDKVVTSDRSEPKPAGLDVEEYFKEACEHPPGPLLECSKTPPPRNLSELEASGGDILLTIRTTGKYHDTRLPVLFDTWLGEVDPGNVFIVTDEDDEDLLWKADTLGMHYVNVHSAKSHNRSDLCCKAGVELELLMSPQNSKYNWLCHIDDDMYVNLKPLVRSLSRFHPQKHKVYYGRSGTSLDEPRMISKESKLGIPGRRYFFAVGGMYCLSRAMLELAEPYLVGCKNFESSCTKTLEPEDVTVGLVIGAVLDQRLRWTEMIYSHGLDLLSATPTPYLKDQVAFSYGFGAGGAWNIIPNVVYIPGALFNIDEDPTQFKSLHCHLHPYIQWCLDKKQQLQEEKKNRQNRPPEEAKADWLCECSWKRIICCQVYKDNYARFVQEKMLKRQRADQEQSSEQSMIKQVRNENKKRHQKESAH